MLASSGLGFTAQPFALLAVYRGDDSRRPLSTDMCSLVMRLIYSARPLRYVSRVQGGGSIADARVVSGKT